MKDNKDDLTFASLLEKAKFIKASGNYNKNATPGVSLEEWIEDLEKLNSLSLSVQRKNKFKKIT